MLGHIEISDQFQSAGGLPSVSERLKEGLIAAGFETEVFINVKSEWSSDHEDYRNIIRENLYHDISKLCSVSKKEFEDLSKIPTHSEYGISISHCRTYGGYTFVKKPHVIGFDVECLNRVTSKIVNRISNPNDSFDTVVNPAFVWVAKEAAFKAIQHSVPVKVIQEIVLHSWNMISANVFEFHIHNLHQHERVKLLDQNGDARLFEYDENHSRGCVIFDKDSAFGFYLMSMREFGGLS